MARGTTLQNLVQMFADEAGLNNSPALSSSAKSMVERLIRRTQIRLYQSYDWPHLHGYFAKSIVAGSRYYDFPTSMDIERIERAWYKWDGTWIEVPRGITLDDYNVYDPEEDQRLDPVLKWEIKDADQFEVWPIPASSGTWRFEGTKQLSDLTNDTDRADLDDNLIVLFTAAEWLLRDSAKAKAAEAKAVEANNHLQRIRGQLSSSRVTSLTGGTTGGQYTYGFADKDIRVAYAGSGS